MGEGSLSFHWCCFASEQLRQINNGYSCFASHLLYLCRIYNGPKRFNNKGIDKWQIKWTWTMVHHEFFGVISCLFSCFFRFRLGKDRVKECPAKARNTKKHIYKKTHDVVSLIRSLLFFIRSAYIIELLKTELDIQVFRGSLFYFLLLYPFILEKIKIIFRSFFFLNSRQIALIFFSQNTLNKKVYKIYI